MEDSEEMVHLEDSEEMAHLEDSEEMVHLEDLKEMVHLGVEVSQPGCNDSMVVIGEKDHSKIEVVFDEVDDLIHTMEVVVALQRMVVGSDGWGQMLENFAKMMLIAVENSAKMPGSDSKVVVVGIGTVDHSKVVVFVGTFDHSKVGLGHKQVDQQ